ncbi:MAG: asparagine synthase (glutamine-hydrolyzing) [Candidatus Aenigmatarchaeota archaeon]
MCGIVGIYHFHREEKVNLGLLQKMANIIKYRGPDDEGFFVHNNFGMGIRRLSIIDIITGHQPIHNEDKSIWIILNGEIYNYIELRRDLESFGHKFYTNSDTETIVHAYEQYGLDFCQYLRGMFAFALWDIKKQQLILARDRFGIKPLYYTKLVDKLIFASEIKSILLHPQVQRKFNLKHLDSFLSAGAIHDFFETVFVGINSLPPGQILVISDGNLVIKEYWDIPNYNLSYVQKSEEYYIEQLYTVLQESVKIHLRSDVPVGCFLSGGIDSSTITALMCQLVNENVNTFTVGYQDPVAEDETKKAQQTAEYLKTKHHEIIIDAYQWWDYFPRYIWHTEELVANLSQVTFHFVCELARQRVKVVLCGAGGDELFLGYPRQFFTLELLQRFFSQKRPALLDRVNKILFFLLLPLVPYCRNRRGFLGKVFNMLYQSDTRCNSLVEIFRRNFASMLDFTEQEKRKIYSSDIQTHIIFNNKQHYQMIFEKYYNYDWTKFPTILDLKSWIINDYLLTSDKISMASSLELRVPFFDHKVIDFVMQIPSEIIIRGEKYILRQVLKKLLPPEITERPKQPWVTPIGLWVLNYWQKNIKEILLDSKTLNRGYFNKKYLRRKVEGYFNRLENNLPLIMRLVYLELWHRMFIDNFREIKL